MHSKTINLVSRETSTVLAKIKTASTE